MGKKIPRITNSEMQILEVLWDEGEALTSSEIVEVSDDRTWKSSSVHIIKFSFKEEVRSGCRI